MNYLVSLGIRKSSLFKRNQLKHKKKKKKSTTFAFYLTTYIFFTKQIEKKVIVYWCMGFSLNFAKPNSKLTNF